VNYFDTGLASTQYINHTTPVHSSEGEVNSSDSEVELGAAAFE
jgi:hypothetical protein